MWVEFEFLSLFPRQRKCFRPNDFISRFSYLRKLSMVASFFWLLLFQIPVWCKKKWTYWFKLSLFFKTNATAILMQTKSTIASLHWNSECSDFQQCLHQDPLHIKFWTAFNAQNMQLIVGQQIPVIQTIHVSMGYENCHHFDRFGKMCGIKNFRNRWKYSA